MKSSQLEQQAQLFTALDAIGDCDRRANMLHENELYS